jgi:hypothetical protein
VVFSERGNARYREAAWISAPSILEPMGTGVIAPTPYRQDEWAAASAALSSGAQAEFSAQHCVAGRDRLYFSLGYLQALVATARGAKAFLCLGVTLTAFAS